MKKYSKILFVFLVFLFSSCENALLGPEPGAPPAAKVYSSRLATILDSLRYAMNFPALAGAIVTENGIVDAQAVGCRRYGGEANVTNTDCFHLGSCGKSFTAVLMGTLVDEGKVFWNTTLQEIFPEFASTMRKEYKAVTVREILSHSAGFIRDHNITLSSGTYRERRNMVAEWGMAQVPVVQRGKFLYSNLGYIIAGAIIEKLLNRTYEELMTERILRPLGLTTAGFGTMGTEGREDQPLQHTPGHAPLTASQSANLGPEYNPAGGLFMSVIDWAKYCQWILKIEAGLPQSILNDNTAKELTKPIVDEGYGWRYAFGWGVVDQDWAGGKSLQHSGSNSFNYCTVWLASDKHFGILVMTNQGAVGEEWPLEKPFWRVLELYQKGK